jgi:hypothetical protein
MPDNLPPHSAHFNKPVKMYGDGFLFTLNIKKKLTNNSLTNAFAYT